jgi:uncharacterized protein YjbI with pentapeptide repeats
MPELTAEVVLKRIKTGEKLERAELRGLAMPGALLEGVSFRRCDLDGANLGTARLAKANFKNASLREAFLAGADLSDANLENADLEGANLRGARLPRANLTRANLEGADLQGADLSGARLAHALLESAKLGGANLAGAHLERADLTDTDLSAARLEAADLKGAVLANADLTESDLRRANLSGARLDDAIVTAALVHAVVGTGAAIAGLKAEWVDTSVAGDKAQTLSGPQATADLLSGLPPVAKRYFGAGDVLRNASLEFGAGAAVEIESLFEQCSIALGEGTVLVVGRAGILSGCQITGPGKLTIHGKFVERESPGIAGVNEVAVSSSGSVIGVVEQPSEYTRFAFEPGCVLRMKIRQGKSQSMAEGGRKSK